MRAVPPFAAACAAVTIVACATLREAAPEPLFDGETLAGWTIPADQAEWWTVEEGAITGGSLERVVPHNTFLETVESFENFELTLSIRIRSTGGFANSGIQIRSRRVPDGIEMSGYQVDAGDGWWGCLYDEARRNRVIARSAETEAIVASIRHQDWNDYRILAEGRRIRSWINGLPALDYTEPDVDIPRDGVIAVQVHSGGPVQVQVRDVTIRRLPPTTNAMTWERLDARASMLEQGKAPWRSPEDERAAFTLADGFELDLVASEEVTNKLVEIGFDDRGRMWGLTAVEYPIDANEDPRAAAKYQGGGRDAVVVFDDVWSGEMKPPRVFADGFAMPMAVLPEGDSVLLAHGPEILRLYDDDGDGVSDRREVILDGFGIQDSHLMPHRFVRAPGGWIYVAQGAFNSSNVRTKSGEVVEWNKCKLGRFRRDGSRFEVVGIGLNNIWGFVLDRRGNKWIQEANDLGYPLVPFHHGASYPGIGMDKFHPLSPWQPPIANTKMGGSGLSGLARSEDESGGYPAPWNEVFFVANPIMSSIQCLRVEPGERPSDLRVVREDDFLVSADPNFRPVAIHFGPDGCLYVVDWYNPIISHNEVPRDDPNRDKESTRIWRIRHETQSRERPLDVTTVSTRKLPGLLDSDSTWISRAAWRQIAARRADELGPQLEALAADPARRIEARILALWSLEDLGLADTALVESALASGEAELVREGARMSAGLGLGAGRLASVLAPLAGSEDPSTRYHAIEALGSVGDLDGDAVRALLGFVRDPLDGPTVRLEQNGQTALTGLAGEVAFERSLVRVLLEPNAGALTAVVESADFASLGGETQLFAASCLQSELGARTMAELLGELGRPPTPELVAALARHAEVDLVADLLVRWLDDSATRADALRAMSAADVDSWAEALGERLVASLRRVFAEVDDTAQLELALELARDPRMAELEEGVVGLFERVSPALVLRTLIEMGSGDASLFGGIAMTSVPGSEVRRLAVGALAAVGTDEAFAQLLARWSYLDVRERRAALTELLSSDDGAARVLGALDEDDIELESLDGIAWARLAEHVGDDERFAELRARAGEGRLRCVRLEASKRDYVDTNLSLEGPFTVEGWMYLEEGIDNADVLFGAGGTFELNFWNATARLYVGAGGGDVIIATAPSTPERWFHLAVTRDGDGELRLYLDGELDQTSSKASPERFEGLDLGRSTVGSSTHGRLAEVRVWNVARSATEIWNSYRRSFAPGEDVPGLVFSSTRDELPVTGKATVEPAFDAPPVQTAEEARAQHERFETFRALATAPGDAASGRAVFEANCIACHRVAGEGVSIGPALDGASAKGVDGLLRSVLTPNAGVESGYRTLLVRTTDGRSLDGFLAAEDADSITLRRKDREDLILRRDDIEHMRFDRLSLMPEGLLDPLSEREVADLFAYLTSL